LHALSRYSDHEQPRLASTKLARCTRRAIPCRVGSREARHSLDTADRAAGGVYFAFGNRRARGALRCTAARSLPRQVRHFSNRPPGRFSFGSVSTAGPSPTLRFAAQDEPIPIVGPPPAINENGAARSQPTQSPALAIEQRLSPCEAEIARLVAAGPSNKQIARRASIAEGTVKIHLHRAYQKLGIANRAGLAVLRRWRAGSTTVMRLPLFRPGSFDRD
jgi:DNA-binding CsgD family transcriptional regulator